MVGRWISLWDGLIFRCSVSFGEDMSWFLGLFLGPGFRGWEKSPAKIAKRQFKSPCEWLSGWWFQIFFNFHPYLGEWSNLTNIFQMGWNHQLVMFVDRIRSSRLNHELSVTAPSWTRRYSGETYPIGLMYGMFTSVYLLDRFTILSHKNLESTKCGYLYHIRGSHGYYWVNNNFMFLFWLNI